MSSGEKLIAWIDVETSGLTPEVDFLLEVGAVMSDMSGNQIGETFSSTVSVDNLSRVISRSSPLVVRMHEDSGLWADLWNDSGNFPHKVDESLNAWFKLLSDSENIILMGGNSLTLDRCFMKTYLPKSYRNLSHQSIDVTSVSIMLQHAGLGGYTKRKNHRALDDALDSLQEYRHYRETVASSLLI